MSATKRTAVAEDLFRLMIEVANGRKVRSEIPGYTCAEDLRRVAPAT